MALHEQEIELCRALKGPDLRSVLRECARAHWRRARFHLARGKPAGALEDLRRQNDLDEEADKLPVSAPEMTSPRR